MSLEANNPRRLSYLNTVVERQAICVRWVPSVAAPYLSAPYSDDERNANELVQGFYIDIVLQEPVSQSPILFNNRLYEEHTLRSLITTNDHSNNVPNPGGAGTVSRDSILAALNDLGRLSPIDIEYSFAVIVEYNNRGYRRSVAEQQTLARRQAATPLNERLVA